MQYDEDYRVSTKSSQIVYDGVRSSDKQLVWLNGSGHVMIEGNTSIPNYEQIYEFILSNIK
jgi:esterase/lipase